MGHVLGFPKRAFQILGPYLGFPQKHFRILGSYLWFPKETVSKSLVIIFRVSQETVSNPWVIFRVSPQTVSKSLVIIFRVSQEAVSNPWDSLFVVNERGILRICASLDMRWNHSHHSFHFGVKLFLLLAFGCAHKRWKKSFQKRERERERERDIGSVLKGKVE